jgi:pimeloyl-ACP methyl ester carboxylesterase
MADRALRRLCSCPASTVPTSSFNRLSHRCLRDHTSVVSYPGSRQHGYADLLEVVREKVAAVSKCNVLGWSFSGPLALMLAAAEPEKMRGVILSASFVRAPRSALVALRFACVVVQVGS